jgi:hypothetical protein
MGKYLWVLVVVAVAVGVYFAGGWKWLGKVGVETSPTSTPIAGVSQTVVKIGSAATSSVTYTNLVNTYANKRIQFDMNCQAVPNNITYKSGTTIMLDNRSGDARVISVGGIKYQLSGYGYAIVTLYGQTLPKQLFINCGAAVNVGVILLQK